LPDSRHNFVNIDEELMRFLENEEFAPKHHATKSTA
jgi:hypothetical protein